MIGMDTASLFVKICEELISDERCLNCCVSLRKIQL